MVPGSIKIIYFCFKNERRKDSTSLNFQMVLQQIHPYSHLHVGGGPSVNTLLKCTRKYFCIILKLHIYHPPWKYANSIYANSSLFYTYLYDSPPIFQALDNLRFCVKFSIILGVFQIMSGQGNSRIFVVHVN